VVTYGAIVGCWRLLRVVYTHAADNDSRGEAMSDEGRYITAEIAAERLGVSERSVYRYADYEGGRLRTRKAGRCTLFHEGDVQLLADDLGVQRQGPVPTLTLLANSSPGGTSPAPHAIMACLSDTLS
jgi:hypothetical protein